MVMIASKATDIELINLDNGTIVANRRLVTSVASDGFALETDGLEIYANYNDGSANLLRRCIPNGNDIGNLGEVSASAWRDICFDGLFWYTLGGTNVNKFVDPLLQNQVDSWAHGITNPQGLFFNGMFLVIIA